MQKVRATNTCRILLVIIILTGNDYGNPVPSLLVFPVGTTSRCTDIPIINDDIYEGSETFSVSLASPSSSVNVSGSSAGVLIIDDDGMVMMRCYVQDTYFLSMS